MKQLRCFKNKTLQFDQPITLIEAANGAGKTTVLETLYYMCYLRSFRSHRPNDLVKFGSPGFFCKAEFDVTTEDTAIAHELQVGFTDGTRRVKLDNQRVVSYQDLMSSYRVISITEHDLALISDGPHVRRNFLDNMIMLNNPEYMLKIRLFRAVLEQRNMLLMRGARSKDTYDILTEQLYTHTAHIQQERMAALQALSDAMHSLMHEVPGIEHPIALSYKAKILASTLYETKRSDLYALQDREMKMKRSLFGAHLDDIEIMLDGKQSKQFASRGQQKLIVLIIKCAQLQLLNKRQGGAVMLIDDFMTDFDLQRINTFIHLFASLNSQLIFTCPITKSPLHYALEGVSFQCISLIE